MVRTPDADGRAPAASTEDGDTATATLAWAWPVAGDEWSYTTDVDADQGRRRVADDLVPRAGRAEPAARRPSSTPPRSAAPAAPILGADGIALVTDRDVVRFGIDRVAGVDGPRPASPRASSRGSSTSTRRRTPSGSRPPATRRSSRRSRSARTTCRPRSAQGYCRIKGARRRSRTRSRSRRPATSRLPILGTVGEVTAEMVKERPGHATRSATRPGCPGCRRGTTSSCRASTARSSTRSASDGHGARALPGRRRSRARRWS